MRKGCKTDMKEMYCLEEDRSDKKDPFLQVQHILVAKKDVSMENLKLSTGAENVKKKI